MQSTSSKGRGAIVVTALLAAIALYLIARSTIGSLAAASPAYSPLAAGLPPEDLRGRVRLAARLAQHPQFPAGEAELALARRGLESSPTSHEPFFIAAKAAERAGRTDRAIRLTEEVRVRRPHMASVKLQLFMLYGKARRYESMFRELDLALRLNEQARLAVLPELTKLIADPAGRDALAKVLAEGPPWRVDFSKAAKGRKVPPAAALALWQSVQKRTNRSAPERAIYLQSLVEAGDFRRAREVWLSALPPADKAKARGPVFDGEFTGSRAPEPFNWTLHDGSAGRAQLSREAGRPALYIDYFGGQDFVLAEQLLTLPAGRYSLSFLVRSEEGVKSGELVWRLACAGTGQVLGTVPFGSPNGTWSRRTGVISVPSQCGGQRLYLLGKPGEMSGEARAQVSAVEVANGG
ncbi:tetratricopeptide repeat protein [Allosphingosinicella sp.]|jgi:hypothetical protein|uniref:tetratricopeptide repeat protein n=1 Tax=Allosphingosinicella sp. TaxID=2823234 RepID=UPI002F04CA8A